VGGTGALGGTGPNGTIAAAQYALIGSPAHTIAIGDPLIYDTDIITTPTIIRYPTAVYSSFSGTGTVFQLVNIGIYEVNYQATYDTPSGIVLNTSPSVNGTYSQLGYTMIGKNISGGQVSGSVLVQTTTANSFIAVNSATGNTSAITLGPNSSITNAAATTVSFKQIA
jgi:hypothetical protein